VSAASGLRGVDVDVRPGELIAVVGRSGVGKSTLAALVLGMITPTRGRVLLDGMDLTLLDLDEVRAQVGVVLQDATFFNDTIRANLTLRDPEVPLDRVRAAARLACIDEFIDSLPEGYETVVGVDACLLSRGQRQRLALARALVREPAILVLDEATSSLDPETELTLVTNLRDLGCTRLVIAHRLSTVRHADRIVVLDGGRVVQQGPFARLVQEPGLFRSLARGCAS
jgi:subfamily B ATP-binding cassette protein HlyB/CyaB